MVKTAKLEIREKASQFDQSLLVETQREHLRQSIKHLQAYMSMSTLGSSLAIAAEVDDIYDDLTNLYLKGYIE